MTEKIWLGGIYLKNEGGYEIILKSLNHYKKRLKTLDDSPELKDSGAMFASILNQQAMKTVTKIHEMIEKILNYLKDIQIVNFVDEDISFLEKALTCYESDIHKAEDTGYEYFVNLVGNMLQARKDLQVIKIALLRINQFSD
ncbi:MAG: hypothetical protein CO032_07205 [Nitrosopumilales archaeon CG_4_9_14_0_2_um_filter_34_16]|jgi:hypothetical protein|nr:MAG: hypothetical protein CO032_07205 [Nitrosopumilales archaeon CG_4_9_14_0_2_um_filter_34_16]